MKSERCLTFCIAVVLAFLLSFGSIGCLITGFSIEADMTALALGCLLAAAFSALLAGRKWGGMTILGLLAAGIVFFCFSRTAQGQLNDLIRWISDHYYRAYGWEWLWHGEVELGDLGYPLGFLGGLVATQAGWTVVRREDTFSAVLASLLPMGACLVVTDTVPHVPYLYLLILGLLLLILTSGLRGSDGRQANVLTMMAALPLALALWGLFLAVPEESYVNKPEAFYQTILDRYPNLTWQVTDNSANGSAEGTQVDLKDVGPLIQRQYPVMDVSAPFSGTMYLRGQDYDVYNGTGWTASPDRKEILSGGEQWLESRGTVTIATLSGRECFYIPYYAAGDVEVAGGMAKNPQFTTAYGFALRTLPENWRELAGTSMEYVSQTGPASGLDSRYRELPEDTRAWAEELLKTILPGDVPTAWERAEIIAAYVRDSARYDVNTPKMPTDQQDFVRWFLTESDTGYCVHFASTTAVLLRAAGIPARYVTGYMFQAVAGTPVTVRADKSHAWVEYYEDQLGMWLVLESTPPMPDAPPETLPEQTQTTEPQDTTGDTGPTEGTSPAPSDPGAADPTDASRPAGDGQKPAPQKPVSEEQEVEASEGPKGLLLALIIGAVLMAALLGQRSWRIGLRRRRAASGSSNQRALVRWQELELLYRRLGRIPPRELEELAQKARFSQHQLTEGELQVLDIGLETARTLCRQRPWHRRLVDRWFYAAY